MQFMQKVTKLNPDDYIDIMSLKQEEYYKYVEYKVPDNWWHSDEYLNVPLNDFMSLVKTALGKGYTFFIGGDISEPGFLSDKQVAFVPTFDIPSSYINEDSRQFRFSNKTTTDDHGMHIVGYTVVDSVTWFLVKDSGSGSRNGSESSESFGYYFMSEDYLKLKIVDITIHKDLAKDLITKTSK